MKKEHGFYHLKPQKVTIIIKTLKPTSRKSDYSLNCEKETIPLTSMLEQGCFTSHLLSFDNNKVLKIINWIC